MRMVTGGLCAVLMASMMYGHALTAPASCESLASLARPNTSTTLAQMVPAGGFTLPGMAPPAAQQFSRLPAFCRVAATLTPSSDSDIKVEVWLPASEWNGKFQAVGNGGWAGNISYGALASALQEGYATASTDTASLALPNTSITLAQMVPAGGFTLPGMAPPAAQQFSRLRAFCRVAATLTPSSDSDIRVEVWLPASEWNGKFQAVGNGGWAGNISYGALASALQEGYATASTDTGHTGGTGSFAVGHPEKVIDFAYRAVHEMAVKSKAIIAAFYDRAPRFSYWTGCSTGGRQGLMAAQRYPEDF